MQTAASLSTFPKNLFSVLGVSDREDVITNVLAHLIECSPEFRGAFFKTILESDAGDFIQFKCHSRRMFGRAIPDLIIEACGPRRVAFVIENKLKAGEGYSQTSKYTDAEQAILAEFECEEARFVFLTLFPDQIAQGGSRWRSISYDALLAALRGYRGGDCLLLDKLVLDLMQLLDEFYSHAALDLRAPVARAFRSRDELGGGYLAFKSFVGELAKTQPTDRCFETFRLSGNGRHSYGAKVYRKDENWHPERLEIVDHRAIYNPSKHFDVHFELQYESLNEGATLNLYLHYELNPYLTRRSAEHVIGNTQLARHEETKRKFMARMRELAIPGMAVEGRFIQVGKVQFSLLERDTSTVLKSISDFLNEAVPKVDGVLTSKAWLAGS